MKKGPYKMKGYSYPGNSPLKGAKARRQQQIAENRMAGEDMIDGAWEDTGIDEATDLMKSEGFTVNVPSPVTKRSPAKVASAIPWDKITESAIQAGVEGGVQLGVEALKPKQKKGHQGPDVSGFSKLKFGRS